MKWISFCAIFQETVNPQKSASTASIPETELSQPKPNHIPDSTHSEKTPVTVPSVPVTDKPKEAIQNDPAITLDYKSTEMKTVLEKASSTEVIPALTLDARRKSNSVTSLGSSCHRSDSFRSVSSMTFNGAALNKSGSSTSITSTKNHTDNVRNLVRVRSESGRPLSDAVSRSKTHE